MLNNELKLGVLDERIVPFLNILTICADEVTKGQNCWTGAGHNDLSH